MLIPHAINHRHGSATRSLVVMHVPKYAGYAIQPLELLFAQVLSELGDGNANVAFAYPCEIENSPDYLPSGVTSYGCGDSSSPNYARRVQAIAAEHQADFVLLFDHQPVSPVARAIRKAGVKCVLSYWGAEISSRNSPLVLAAKRIEIALSRSRLDGLIFESHAMADLAIHGRGVPRSMIDVVPLGIDTSPFREERAFYVNQVMGIPADQKIIVYAGHMEERKGVSTLIKAAHVLVAERKRDDVTFLIFGDRPGESGLFSHLLDDPRVAEKVVFGGYRGDLPACFTGCFAGVIPSTGWDSFPRTSLEIAAAGLPLIASRLGGLPECLVDGKTGILIEPGNERELAHRIEELLANPALAKEMGTMGRIRCEREFSVEAQRFKLRQVFLKRLSDTMR